MSRGVLALSGAGGLAGLYGVYELIHETHHRSGWFWLFLGATVLFVVQIQTVQRALVERDAALASTENALPLMSGTAALRSWLDERIEEIKGIKKRFQELLLRPTPSYDGMQMSLDTFWEVNNDVARRLHQDAPDALEVYALNPDWYDGTITRDSREECEEVVRLMDYTIDQLAHIRAYVDPNA
jgi:hypothetical protein